MKKIEAIIIDDEKDNIEVLQLLLSKHCPNVEIVGTALNAEQAERAIEKYSPHLIFLDVEMPGRNGIQFLEEVEARSFHTIMVTAYPQYALDALKQEALDYILKPIDADELKEAVAKVDPLRVREDPKNIRLISLLDEPSAVDRKLIIPSKSGFKSIDIRTVIYIQGTSGNYCILHLSSGEQQLTTKPLNYFEDILVEHRFFRVHRAYLLNLDKVENYDSPTGKVTLMDGTELTVSTRKRSSFRHEINS